MAGAIIATIILIIGTIWVWKYFIPHNRFILKIGKFVFRWLLARPSTALWRAVKFILGRVFKPAEYLAHRVFLDNYPISTLEFYQTVEELFISRQVVGAEISRITRYEWHLFSARRIYLQIRFREARCIISGLAIGTGFQLTWRYAIVPNKFYAILFDMPFIGQLAERLVSPPTFHRHDLYPAFEQLVRATITDSTNALTAQGLRPLTENEVRPLLREFYE